VTVTGVKKRDTYDRGGERNKRKRHSLSKKKGGDGEGKSGGIYFIIGGRGLQSRRKVVRKEREGNWGEAVCGKE